MSAVPSIDYRSYLNPQEAYRLYNPRGAEVEFSFGGNTYVIPANGTLAITDTKELVTELNEPEMRVVPAKTMLEFAVGSDGRSGRVGICGVRVLLGGEFDDEIIAEAKKASRENEYKTDLTTQYAHKAACKVAKDAGQPIPAPGPNVRAAMARIAAYEASNDINAPFKCESCGWPFYDQQSLASHREATTGCGGKQAAVAEASSNSSEVAELKASVAALTGIVTALVTQRKGGRPKKSE